MPRVVREPRQPGARAQPLARAPERERERNPRSISTRPSRLKLLLRRQRRLIRPALWAIASGLALTLLVASSGSTVGTLRERLGHATGGLGLRVTAIDIEGRSNTPEPLVRAALGVSVGDPTLGFSVAAARARLEGLTWVQHATVERVLPGKIVVALTERRPFAIWQHDGRFVLIDRDGQIVADEQVATFRTLPLVVGAGAPAAATALLDALRDRPAIASHVIASVRVAQRRWNLRLGNGCDVMLPESQEIAALDRLAQLQQEHQLLDRPLQAIDLRLPDRVVMRPQPNAAGTPPPVPPNAPANGRPA